MAETWTLKAVLRLGFLLIDENYEVIFEGTENEPGLIGYPKSEETQIKFGRPKRVEDPGWSSWDTILAPAWDYDISIRFSAKDEKEAQSTGWPLVERIASRLSFYGSAPVTIKSPGNLTNAPEKPSKGTQYKWMGLNVQRVTELTKVPKVNKDQINQVLESLIRSSLLEDGGERIDRSMRWLQQSHHALSPTDEFLCLMLSFEAISHLLKKPEPRYWRCNACRQVFTNCPKCGASTKSGMSGVPPMRHFVCNKPRPGWSPGKWDQVWELRCKIVHGDQDLSREEQRIVVSHLRSLEEVVVYALRGLLQLSPGSPPLALRARSKFDDAILTIVYTTPQ